jgi:hypothetical protein
LYFLNVASFSSCVRLGGNAGRVDGSYAGALTAYRSDWPDVTDVPVEMAEVPDRAVAIELTDSLDALRFSIYSDCLLLPVEGASEGRLGGKAGDSEGLVDTVDAWEDCVGVLGGRAGLEMPSIPFAIPFGWPPSGKFVTPALVAVA